MRAIARLVADCKILCVKIYTNANAFCGGVWKLGSPQFLLEPEVGSCQTVWCGLQWEVASGSSW